MSELFGVPVKMRILTTISWKRAFSLSLLAVYGPFVFMALYTLLFVPCSHCKAAAWTLLPWGPGLLPMEAGRQWLEISRPTDAVAFTFAFIISVFVVLSLAGLVRRSRWLRFVSIAVALAVFSIIAMGTLNMIQA